MKNILARIFALYAILVFIITLIPIYLFLVIAKMVLSPKNFSATLQKTFQVWMGVFMPAIFCPVTHVGRQHFASDRNYVVVINHSSLLDIPVSSPGIVGANKTLGKASFARTPLFGFIYKAGSILIDRSSAKSRAQSFQKMIECLQSGMHLCLYPEGTRNKTNAPLIRFHDGAFKVAIATQTPIMPAIIQGTKDALPANKFFWLLPQRITFTFMEPIETTNLSLHDLNELKEKVFKLMWEKLEA